MRNRNRKTYRADIPPLTFCGGPMQEYQATAPSTPEAPETSQPIDAPASVEEILDAFPSEPRAFTARRARGRTTTQ